MKPETILAIRDENIRPLIKSEGMITDLTVTDLLDNQNACWLSRQYLEHDDDYRQIIPYTLIKYKNRYLCYQRTSKSAEKRLHGSMSIGIGGHVSLQDIQITSEDYEFLTDIEATIKHAANRELKEEFYFENFPENVKHVGIIYDIETEVGRVHLGVIEERELEGGDITICDEGISKLQFYTLEELSNSDIYDNLENWSQMIVRGLATNV